MKKIAMAGFICMVAVVGMSFFLPVSPAVATPSQKETLEVYERLYKKVERQFNKLEKDATRRFSKRSFNPVAWDRMVERWDLENLMVKGEAKSYEEWAPLLFDHVIFNLRHLTVIAYEYRRFFHSEESDFSGVEKDIQAFHQGMEQFRLELDYLKEKVKLTPPDFQS